MPTPVETFAASLNEADQNVLHASIAFALRVAAKADNVVDGKEEKAIAGLSGQIRERVGEAFAGAPESYPDAMRAAAHPDWTQGPFVQQLLDILKRMPDDARASYDAALIELAFAVAGASGGILGFGEKVSVEERYALRRLVGTLRLRVDDPSLKKTLGYD
jgi:hypothetical protein